MSTLLHQGLLAWIQGRARSFTYAFRGLGVLSRERNSHIHFAATAAIVSAGLALRISRIDWLYLVVAMTGVWVAEAFNTALEALANAAVPEAHPMIKAAKDVAAGAVLLAAIGAVCIGGLVFVPRFGHQ